ncbi:uncharacterized protein [Ptychodera flava]|uniref:uncharacterized protein n=1 Tax=Ptychodera flava TaxID=63121 RepID=UPI00396A332F
MNTGPGCNVGANEMLAILRTKYDLKVTRELVRDLVRILDPGKVKQRHMHRLIRREYRCKGPNYVWHIDGYDKLSPYGLAIHGCIDGFSRKVLWLKVGVSNHDPRKVAAYFIDTVGTLEGCPRIVRADHGTETGLLMTVQAMLRANGDDAFADNSYWYGPSTANQRIERWWGILRMKSSDWWIDHFKELVTDGHLQLGDPVNIMTVHFCYLDLLQNELDEVVQRWNHHRIRRQNRGDCVSGIPDILYSCPELQDHPACRDYIHSVDADSTTFTLCKSQCDFYNKGDEDFAVLARNICNLNGWNPEPKTALEARQLYLHLAPCIEELLDA